MVDGNEQCVTIPEGEKVRIIVTMNADWPQRVTLTSEAGGVRWTREMKNGSQALIYAGANIPGHQYERVPSSSIWVSIWYSPNGGSTWDRSWTRLIAGGPQGAHFMVESKDAGSPLSDPWDDAVVRFHWA